MNLITIDREKCNQDGICVSECPARILVMEKDEGFPVPSPEFEEYCIRCGHCVAVCPSGALSLDWLEPENCRKMDKTLALTPEQVEQFLRGRRSIRSFKEKTVPRETLEKLLEVACSAPSAKNKQPWHWIVVQEPQEVRRVAGLVVEGMRDFLESDPEEGKTRGYHRVVFAWDAGIDRICREAPHLIIVHAEQDWTRWSGPCALILFTGLPISRGCLKVQHHPEGLNDIQVRYQNVFSGEAWCESPVDDQEEELG